MVEVPAHIAEVDKVIMVEDIRRVRMLYPKEPEETEVVPHLAIKMQILGRREEEDLAVEEDNDCGHDGAFGDPCIGQPQCDRHPVGYDCVVSPLLGLGEDIL